MKVFAWSGANSLMASWRVIGPCQDGTFSRNHYQEALYLDWAPPDFSFGLGPPYSIQRVQPVSNREEHQTLLRFVRGASIQQNRIKEEHFWARIQNHHRNGRSH